ncbi:PR domain zinc finger protein 12 [Araneus ventricosus]|uniref:PR domain zinc finger protein 12 n=1 Tax=Araneus ventricosus TaxID=182803 RepID=A0A4Y2PXT4_ARAVE|nr:PR domain zinc finger protein 12 [Araneus ventricosus]
MGCSVEHDRDSWMTLIQTARHTQEQNLETFEAGGAIYYRATKDIQAGEELLVWYGLHIEQCFGLPCFESRKTHKTCLEETSFPEEGRRRVRCVICHKGFNSRSNLRSHMRTHTQQKPFKCDVCRRRFSQSSTLRNHTRLHTGKYNVNVSWRPSIFQNRWFYAQKATFLQMSNIQWRTGQVAALANGKWGPYTSRYGEFCIPNRLVQTFTFTI